MADLNNISVYIENSRKTLFILSGFPYAGKSYVAKELHGETNSSLISIDEIFSRLGFDWDTNKVPKENEWKNIFEESYEQTKQALQDGRNVLYDSTNQTITSRNKLRDVAKSAGASARVLYVKTSPQTVWKRWEENQNHSKRPQISRELVQMTIDMFEEPTQAENAIVVEN